MYKKMFNSNVLKIMDDPPIWSEQYYKYSSYTIDTYMMRGLMHTQFTDLFIITYIDTYIHFRVISSWYFVVLFLHIFLS